MNRAKKTYIVTGGSSGIGYHLVKRLAETSNVIALDRSAEQTDLVDHSCNGYLAHPSEMKRKSLDSDSSS